MRKHNWLLLFFVFFNFSLVGQDTTNDPVIKLIREEGLNHSRVDSIAHFITDVSGPRLTNSPGYRRAAEWTVGAMRRWGFSNVQLEPWGNFGAGWEIRRNYIAMVSPYYHSLIAYPVAWSHGTNGLLKGTVVELPKFDSATIAVYAGQIKGKFVMLTDTVKKIRPAFEPYSKRYSDSELVNMKNLFYITREEIDKYLEIDKKTDFLDSMLRAKGPVAILSKDYGGRDGSVYADASESFRKVNPNGIPNVVLSTEDLLRIQRLLESKISVELEMDLQTKFYQDDLKGYNVVAELPGTDPSLKSELVMIGGHLDSWYAGTGATDNAAGCAVMIEVMRILKTISWQPKRTIRMVLWGGEEQGLIGSFNYVKKHFGDPSTMVLKPEHAKVSAYYNLDNGSGKIRGIFAQGNEAVKPIFEKWFLPFHDLGAGEVSLSLTSSTDHISFDELGIPGFQFIQDPLEYLTRTHHSNMDTYEHLSIDDLKQAATIIAAFVYQTATRPDKMPRKPLPSPHRFVFDGF